MVLLQIGFAEERVISAVQELSWLVLGAAIIGILARRMRVPYAVALVLGGLVIEESHVGTVPHIEPSVVLFAFLPPLLFDAAFRIDARELRRYLRPILLLAVPGVVATTFIVGGIVAVALELPLTVGLLFGSLVSTTDPVAVVGILKEMSLPARLSAIPEAESLINDGMAITLYAGISGLIETGTTSLGELILLFLREVGGGVLIGVALGLFFAHLTTTIDDHLIEMMLSVVLAYGSYLVADNLNASGALACVAAGIVQGTYGRSIGMTQRTSDLLNHLWEFLGFFANAILFLLIGLSVDLQGLRDNAEAVAVAIVAVFVSRFVVVEGVNLLVGLGEEATPLRERVLLTWAGLRGAVTIALALGLPSATPERDLLIHMSFGVVLFTLIAQGLTMPLLIKRLGLKSVSPLPAS